MIYGYARVSTAGQARDGNSLEAQQRDLKAAGAEVIFSDKFTGTKMNRPEFQKLLSVVDAGDTVIVTKMDRFARSVVNGSAIMQELLEKGVVLNILNMGKIDNTPTGRLIKNIFLSFAEFERDMIVQRTSEGKAIAKMNNPEWREGRKKEVYIPNELIYEVKAGKKTVASACRELGISRASWYNEIKKRRC